MCSGYLTIHSSRVIGSTEVFRKLRPTFKKIEWQDSKRDLVAEVIIHGSRRWVDYLNIAIVHATKNTRM
jgi:hypothetical protein